MGLILGFLITFLIGFGVMVLESQVLGSRAQRYREFVREGLQNRPWEAVRGQIYLGSEAFIERHSPGNRELKEIPRAQVRAVRPTLERILKGSDDRAIVQAYKEHGYRLHEIAAHLGVHYATVSRRLKRMENV